MQVLQILRRRRQPRHAARLTRPQPAEDVLHDRDAVALGLDADRLHGVAGAEQRLVGMTGQDVIRDGLAEVTELDAAAESILVDEARALQPVGVDELASDQPVAADDGVPDRLAVDDHATERQRLQVVERAALCRVRIGHGPAVPFGLACRAPGGAVLVGHAGRLRRCRALRPDAGADDRLLEDAERGRGVRVVADHRARNVAQLLQVRQQLGVGRAARLHGIRPRERRGLVCEERFVLQARLAHLVCGAR